MPGRFYDDTSVKQLFMNFIKFTTSVHPQRKWWSWINKNLYYHSMIISRHFYLLDWNLNYLWKSLKICSWWDNFGLKKCVTKRIYVTGGIVNIISLRECPLKFLNYQNIKKRLERESNLFSTMSLFVHDPNIRSFITERSPLFVIKYYVI